MRYHLPIAGSSHIFGVSPFICQQPDPQSKTSTEDDGRSEDGRKQRFCDSAGVHYAAFSRASTDFPENLVRLRRFGTVGKDIIKSKLVEIFERRSKLIYKKNHRQLDIVANEVYLIHMADMSKGNRGLWLQSLSNLVEKYRASYYR
eukprot:392642_1